MKTGKVQIQQVLQVGIVVKDLEKSMEHYKKILGISNWKVGVPPPSIIGNPTVRGKRAPFTMKVAMARVANLEWELVQPLTGPSTYQEFLDQHGEGIHHIAFNTASFEETVAALKANGIGILMSADMPDDTFAYTDSQEKLGMIMEIYSKPKVLKD